MTLGSTVLGVGFTALAVALAPLPARAQSDHAELTALAVHINRTPKQSWPGYGIYLGNGLILTASHVAGEFAQTKPHVVISGQDLPAALVKEGTLDTIDLTLLSIEGTAPSRILPRQAIPADLRGRFDTTIADVATTGNSGSGVFDAGDLCLLGIMSRKISVSTRPFTAGAPPRTI